MDMHGFTLVYIYMAPKPTTTCRTAYIPYEAGKPLACLFCPQVDGLPLVPRAALADDANNGVMPGYVRS